MTVSQRLLQLTYLLHYVLVAFGQNNCYFGPGAKFRGPSDLVPCNSTGVSSCCLLGDTCLSGNACYNHATGNTYQYGCTDINYEHSSCPAKCGSNPHLSPWVGLDICDDVPGVSNTWTCLSPESCGCEWHDSYALQILPTRACAAMGSKAIVALYAPTQLLPYVSLPSAYGGSTGYYSTTILSNGEVSVISTSISGYTPTPFTQFTTYQDLGTSIIAINAGATPSPSASHAVASLPDGSIPPPDKHLSSSSQSIARSTSLTHQTTHHRSFVPSSRVPSPTSHHTVASSSTAARVGHDNNPQNTSAASSASSGLSTDAKIGIGVGAGVGAIIIAVIIGLCLRRSRARKKAQGESTPPPQYPSSPPMTFHTPSQVPNNWATANPHGMSYYVAAPPVVPEKDGTAINISPPYSPSQSPPPPSELSADQRRYVGDRNSFYKPASTPYRSSDPW